MAQQPPISTEDVLAIQALNARYNWSIDTDLVEDWVSCFTPDGAFVSSAAHEGHEELRAFVRARAEKARGGDLAGAQHWTANLLLERDGDVVRGSSYVTRFAVTRSTGLREVVTLGVYRDELVRFEGEWRFRRRTFVSAA